MKQTKRQIEQSMKDHRRGSRPDDITGRQWKRLKKARVRGRMPLTRKQRAEIQAKVKAGVPLSKVGAA